MNGSNISLSHKTLVRLVSHLAGLYPNPDDPDPVGPWGPVIRKALWRVRWAAGPGQPDPWVWAALNPQPLPPRYAVAVALGQAVVDQVGSLEEMAQALPEGSRSSIAAYVKGFIGRFVDDCGNGHIVIRIPKGGPYPPGDDEPKPIGPEETVLIGVQLALSAGVNPDLGEAGAKLMELGLSRM